MNNYCNRWPVLLVVCALTLCAAPSIPSQAQPKKDLDVVLTASKVVLQPDGTELLKAAEESKPGETLQYTAVYKNLTDVPLKNLSATLPIPNGTTYLPQTAIPSTAMASTDGVHFAVVPLTRVVKDKDGKERVEPVPLSEYRKLRWTFSELPAGKAVTVIARARLSTPLATNAPASSEPKP